MSRKSAKLQWKSCDLISNISHHNVKTYISDDQSSKQLGKYLNSSVTLNNEQAAKECV